MTDLPDFLAARIYDDECTAREATAQSWGFDPNRGTVIVKPDPLEGPASVCGVADRADGEHIQLWDPARVLLECEAKRGILLHYMTQRRRAEALNRAHADNPAIFYPEPWDLSLRYLALPYRDHPDWRESWLPPAPGTVETWGRR